MCTHCLPPVVTLWPGLHAPVTWMNLLCVCLPVYWLPLRVRRVCSLPFAGLLHYNQ